MVAILKSLPEKISTALAIDLKKAGSTEEMQSIINIYMHDHRTGLPRGTPGPMLGLIEIGVPGSEQVQTPQVNAVKPESLNIANSSAADTEQDKTINAASKGGKKGDQGRKGYGQCWECGEYGHPRRECHAFLKRMGKGSGQDGAVAALKGAHGKYGKGGKKGKGKGWKGKGNFNGQGYKGYRSPGKAIGKGFNHWGEDDYTAAWVSEMGHYGYEYDDWEYGYGEANYMGNQMMLLESSGNNNSQSTTNETRPAITTTQCKAVSGDRDPSRGTELQKLSLHTINSWH